MNFGKLMNLFESKRDKVSGYLLNNFFNNFRFLIEEAVFVKKNFKVLLSEYSE